MSVIAEFTAASEAVAELRDAWPADLSVEVERVVPTDGGVAPYVAVRGDEGEGFADLLSAHPAVEDVDLLDRIEDGTLYRVTWDLSVTTPFVGVRRSDLVLLEARYDRNGLWARVRAHEPEGLSRFLEYCRRNDIDVDVHRVAGLSEASPPGARLTAEQETALELAFERGYYDDRRRTSLEELGDELGISRQATAGRLRRGIRNLLEHRFGEDER